MATGLTGLTGELKVSLEAEPRAALDMSVPAAVLNMVKSFKLVFGAEAGQADQIWWDRRTLAGSQPEALDLAGTLKNAFGQTITFANVKAIIVFNRSDEAIGAHAATAARLTVLHTNSTFAGPCEELAKGMRLEAGGIFVITNPAADGWTVTANTGDLLYIENTGAVVEALYDVAIIGEST